MDNRKILALLAAITMTVSAVSCGTDDATDETAIETTLTDEAEENVSDSAEATNSSKTTTSKKSKTTTSKTTAATTAGKSSSSTAKSTSATAAGSSGSSKTTTGGNSGSSSGGSSSDGSGESSGGSSSDGQASGGGNAQTTAAANSGGNSSAATTAASSDDDTKTYDAEIKFSGSPTVSGSNAKVSGSVVTITAGGTYHITGSSSDGQICVDTATEDKVKIVLDGVDITCASGPALFIKEAKKCTVELADGSKNKLKDTTKDKVNDGVIFSNDTLRIKGGGELEITAGNAHGIASDDDVIIEGGTYTINSVKSGIFAHDDITVSGGELTVFGGTNGIKSKGTVNIKGGTMYVSGGTKEEKSSIYAGEALNYTGGYVYAAGNKVTAPANSANPYAVFSYSGDVSGSCKVKFYIDGNEQATLEAKNNFRCVLMMSPELKKGSKVSLSTNDKSTKEFSISETKNVFTVD